MSEETLEELKAIIDNAPCNDWESYFDGCYFKDGDYCVHHFENSAWSLNSNGNLGAVGRSRGDIESLIELMEDKLRLDHLQKCNEVFNKRAGSNYGWRVDWNHNRIAVVDTGVSGVSIRSAIDEHIKKVGGL